MQIWVSKSALDRAVQITTWQTIRKAKAGPQCRVHHFSFGLVMFHRRRNNLRVLDESVCIMRKGSKFHRKFAFDDIQTSVCKHGSNAKIWPQAEQQGWTALNPQIKVELHLSLMFSLLKAAMSPGLDFVKLSRHHGETTGSLSH